MFKPIVVGILAVFVVAATPLCAAGVDPKNLKEYGRGIIKDYSDMKEMGDIEWVWVAPQARLSTYRFKVEKVENLTSHVDRGMEEVFSKALPKTLERVGSKDAAAPVLHVDGGIYWAERANRSKRWIPYAGEHLAQAGVGVELVFKNDKDEIVAKIRHSGREGSHLQDAAEELVDDISQFIRDSK